MTITKQTRPASGTASLLIRSTQKDFAAPTASYFDFFGHRPPCIMKSDPARHTAKSLFGLFSTAVVLAMLHLISSQFKKMFR
jgi:hypothetical protein